MTANILTTREACSRRCRWTRGVQQAGDVRRCGHGRLWRWRASKWLRTRFTADYFELWEPLSPLWNPIAFRRAARSLARESHA